MSLLLKILVLILLIFCNAFFAMSEIAIISLNDNKIKKMAQQGHKKAKKIVDLTSDSSGFLATIQVGVTLAGFLSSASAAQSFTAYLQSGLSALLPSVPISILSTISTLLITIILSYFSLVFGELIPKKIGMQKSEQIAFKVIGILSGVNFVLRPFVKLLSASTNGVLKLFGLDPASQEQTVTEEEILMLVDVGGQKGVIEETEREMIANIFEFGDTTVSENMAHRTEVIAIENTQTVDEAVALAVEHGYSRMPIFEDDLDSILGILYVKDLLEFVGKSVPEDTKLTNLMREAYFVPECKKLSQLFAEMSEMQISLAVVVDEYGGTAGIITMEDLLESIVGNIQDEFDDEDDEISMISENCFTVDGTALIDEINDELDIHLPEGDYDTIAGFMVNQLGKIPEQGENPSIVVGAATLTVDEIDEQRIAKITILKNSI